MNTAHVTLRLTPELLARLERLVDRIQADPRRYPDLAERSRPTKAAVTREALLQGLDAMERRLSREGKP